MQSKQCVTSNLNFYVLTKEFLTLQSPRGNLSLPWPQTIRLSNCLRDQATRVRSPDGLWFITACRCDPSSPIDVGTCEKALLLARGQDVSYDAEEEDPETSYHKACEASFTCSGTIPVPDCGPATFRSCGRLKRKRAPYELVHSAFFFSANAFIPIF